MATEFMFLNSNPVCGCPRISLHHVCPATTSILLNQPPRLKALILNPGLRKWKFQKLGALCKCPDNKDHSILGSIWGPLFKETPKGLAHSSFGGGAGFSALKFGLKRENCGLATPLRRSSSAEDLGVFNKSGGPSNPESLSGMNDYSELSLSYSTFFEGKLKDHKYLRSQ